MQPYRDAFPPEHRETPSGLLSHVQDLMSRDVKIAYLKSLQGYLFHRAYASGALLCPLFPDVPPCLAKWTARAPPVRIIIYSSGSIAAQKDLFRHTTTGDLMPLITDYFDTTNAGLKHQRRSFETIWEAHPALGAKNEWLFLTDSLHELRAAKEAGMQSYLVAREGNALVSEEDLKGVKVVRSFEEVEVGGRA